MVKKIIACMVAATLVLSFFTGCNVTKSELVLISSTGPVEDASLNQGAWSGLVQYAEQKGISNKAYEPKTLTTKGYMDTVSTAVESGAKVIVLSGSAMAETAYEAQQKYTDVNFILVDSVPANADGTQLLSANTVAISFSEEQAGFLAGYAAVADGYTRLGFIGGGETPGVKRYGYGFLQGAEYAANERAMAAGSIEIKYTYAETAQESEATQEAAAAMYKAGTEVIFASCADGNKSVITAAELLGTKVIGADVDQAALSDSVITSATKGISTAVYNLIDAYYNGTFPGGQVVNFSATGYGVGLAMDAAHFRTFTQEEYDKLFAKMMSNTYNIATTIITDTQAINEIPLSAVTLSVQ